MRSTLAAVLASFTFALPQSANAECLLDLLFPRSKVEAATSRPELDNSPTGSVNAAAAAKITSEPRPEKRVKYPEAFYLSYQ